jgi:hypothetical protein
MNDELGWMWKEVVVVYFKTLRLHLLWVGEIGDIYNVFFFLGNESQISACLWLAVRFVNGFRITTDDARWTLE